MTTAMKVDMDMIMATMSIMKNIMIEVDNIFKFNVKRKSLSSLSLERLFASVVWGGIEPPTQGFSVLCSTD